MKQAYKRLSPGIVIGMLRDNEVTQSAIANELRLSEGHVSLVLSASRKSDRVLRHIASLLELPFEELQQVYRSHYAKNLAKQSQHEAAA
ncbi:hypothetical protein KQI63_05970 [bacterium]|nr:hypothetical protein [bacterium]